MSARDELAWHKYHHADCVDSILREHAHELAEKIRAESYCGNGCEYYYADLIDPEVEK